MDYYKIGQRIRKYRKANGLSQEQLAEKIGISVTHMSHIETGNTKLSLQVLVDITTALDVRSDDLLTDKVSNREVAFAELNKTLESCTSDQLKIIEDVVKAIKISLEKYTNN